MSTEMREFTFSLLSMDDSLATSHAIIITHSVVVEYHYSHLYICRLVVTIYSLGDAPYCIVSA